MPTMTIVQTSYVRSASLLRDSQYLSVWFDAIAREGYRIVHPDEDFYVQWPDVIRNHTVTAGISTRATEVAAEFAKGATDDLALQAYSLEEDFLVDFGIYPPERSTVISVDDGYFTWGDAAARDHKYDLWLNLIAATYRTWLPIYGFQYQMGFGPEIPYTSSEDADSFQARWLYDVNLFGPEFVERIGRDRVLSAPAWRVRELDDGGVLIVPTTYYGDDGLAPPRYSREAVARYLGLPYKELPIMNVDE